MKSHTIKVEKVSILSLKALVGLLSSRLVELSLCTLPYLVCAYMVVCVCVCV
jgi:hypothetical protein